MLYFIIEVFRRLANQNRGHIHVMLEYDCTEQCERDKSTECFLLFYFFLFCTV